jgi:hypothetical protein
VDISAFPQRRLTRSSEDSDPLLGVGETSRRGVANDKPWLDLTRWGASREIEAHRQRLVLSFDNGPALGANRRDLPSGPATSIKPLADRLQTSSWRSSGIGHR